MSVNMSELLFKLTGNMNQTQRIGSTTTINEQVDDMESTLSQMKRNMQQQQKQQSQLAIKLRKFQENTKTNFHEMNKQFSDRIQYLTNLFKGNNDQQCSQFEHMQKQNQILHQQHDKMNQIGAHTQGRTSTLQSNVGV